MPQSEGDKVTKAIEDLKRSLTRDMQNMVKELNKLNQTFLSIGQIYAKAQKDIEIRAEER